MPPCLRLDALSPLAAIMPVWRLARWWRPQPRERATHRSSRSDSSALREDRADSEARSWGQAWGGWCRLEAVDI